MMFRNRSPFAAAALAAVVSVFAVLASPVAAQGKLANLPDFTELYEKQSAAVTRSMNSSVVSTRSRVAAPRHAISISSRSVPASLFRRTGFSSPTRMSSTVRTK